MYKVDCHILLTSGENCVKCYLLVSVSPLFRHISWIWTILFVCLFTAYSLLSCSSDCHILLIFGENCVKCYLLVSVSPLFRNISWIWRVHFSATYLEFGESTFCSHSEKTVQNAIYWLESVHFWGTYLEFGQSFETPSIMYRQISKHSTVSFINSTPNL